MVRGLGSVFSALLVCVPAVVDAQGEAEDSPPRRGTPVTSPNDAPAPDPKPSDPAVADRDCPPGYYCEPPPEAERHTPRGAVLPDGSDGQDAASDGDKTERESGRLSDTEKRDTQEPVAERPDAAGPNTAASPRAREAPAPAAAGSTSNPPSDKRRSGDEFPAGLRLSPEFERPAPPPPKAWRRLRLQLRIGAPIFDAQAQQDAGMLVAGAALAYHVERNIGFEGAMDLATGTDYVGAKRNEAVFSGSVLLSPKARDVVPYTFVGPSLGFAETEEFATKRSFAYLGAHLGFGVWWNVAEHARIHLEWLGFLRGRIDGDSSPEYVDYSTGRATNTSGGAVARLGLSWGL